MSRRGAGSSGATWTASLEVVAYEPPKRLTLRSLGGPVNFTVDHELVEEAAARGSRSSQRPSRAPSSRLAERVLARKAEQQFRQDFDRLKELLEARPA